MHVRLNKFVAAVALLPLGAISSVRADILDGRTVATEYKVTFPHGIPGPHIGPVYAVVGPGTELTNFGNGIETVDVDFSDTNILITSRYTQYDFYGGLIFTDSSGTIPRFTGVTINPATTWMGFDPTAVSFNANSIYVYLGYRNPDVGQQISLDLTAMIPEPATWLLVVTVISLTQLRRRRNH